MAHFERKSQLFGHEICKTKTGSIHHFTFFPFFVGAQSGGLDERINDAFMPFALWWERFILTEIAVLGHSIPVVLMLLLSGALFFTLYFGFVNIRHFPTAIQVCAENMMHLRRITRDN